MNPGDGTPQGGQPEAQAPEALRGQADKRRRRLLATTAVCAVLIGLVIGALPLIALLGHARPGR
jgi:hypothetical protein